MNSREPISSRTPPRNSGAITPQTDHEAATWALRLERGELSAEEKAALEAWLRCDPVHRGLLSGYGKFCAELDEQLLAMLPPPVEVFSRGRSEMGEGENGTPRSRWWVPATALAAAAALVVGLWIAWPRGGVEAFATPVAQRQTLALADGTRADLNAQTRLKVDFSDRRQRLVQMEQGEALFDVAKDAARPFVVETPGGKVRVTGTVFNVRTTAAGQLEVTVIEGSVEVSPVAAANVASANEPVRLAGGDQVALDRERLMMRRGEPALANEAAAWREGRVVFDGVPLGEAMARFAVFHGRAIVVAPDVAQLPVGGRYSLDDLDGFLAAIGGAFPVRVQREADGRVRITGP